MSWRSKPRLNARKSIVWTLSANEFKDLVARSKTLADILIYLNLRAVGGNYKTIKQRIEEENIDVSHIRLGLGSNKGRPSTNVGPPLNEVMVENSDYSRGSLKWRLIDGGILKEECKECGASPIWNNKKLVMVLDHINGVSDDHRLENLRLLCPNCNSQTDTFCRKHKRYAGKV